MVSTPKPDDEVVEGWEKIGILLQVDESTARRWERLGLPVYSHGPRLVRGRRSELLAWAASRRRGRAA